MKIAIISDVHSNLEAFQAVLEDMEKFPLTHRINLGDLVGYGPNPKEVIELNQKYGFVTIKGNHEHEIVPPAYRGFSNRVARLAIEKNKEALSEKDIEYLSNLEFFIIFEGMRFVHGVPPRDFIEYIATEPDGIDFDRRYLGFSGEPCFVGHTHRLFLFRKSSTKILKPGNKLILESEKHIINVGGVGQPRDGTPEAKYVLFNPEIRELEVRAVKYDFEKTITKMNEQQLLQAGRLRTGH